MILTNYLMNYDVDWTSQIIEKKNGTSYALELETVLFIDINDMHAYYCRLYVLDPRSAQEVHLAREGRASDLVQSTTPLQSY
jgi:hypothetical protein